LLARPALYIPLFAVLCILATFELGDIKGRAHAVIETPAPPAVGMPVEVASYTFIGIALLATMVTAYARQIFRLAIAGGNASATRVTFAMKGLIPVLHANAVVSSSGAAARFVRATSGFFFDLAMIQLWMLASGSGDFVWRSVASIELAVVITLLAIALNPLAEYDAYRALSELLDIGNLRVASSEALGRIFRGRRRSGDLGLAWYKILGFAYMVLVLIVLTNLVASFLRRASHMPEQRSRYIAAALVVVAWVAYLGRRAWADYRARRVADIALPTGAAPLVHVGTLAVARSRVLRDDLTLVRSDARAPFSASELARSVDVFSYSHRELAPLTEVEAEEDDLLSMAIFRRPRAMLAPEGHELLQVAKALIRSTRPRETHEIVTDVRLMEGYHDRGFSDLVARIEGLSFRELVSRMSLNNAPEVGSILESFAMVARDRVTGLIDAVVMSETKAARRLERLTELMGAVDGATEVDVEYVHAALAATVRPAERDYLEKVRGLPVGFQEKYGILPLILERKAADFDATFVHHARALGLLEPDPQSTEGSWRFALDGPAVLLPSGSRSNPSGLKARWMHRSLRFHYEMRRTAGWKRYRDFLPRGARSTALSVGADLATIPGWYDVPADATDLYVHEGELKAMVHHHLLGTPSLALGGIEYQFLAAFSAAVMNLAPLRRVFICFDSDVDAP
jgi:hypothetical protein